MFLRHLLVKCTFTPNSNDNKYINKDAFFPKKYRESLCNVIYLQVEMKINENYK